MRPGESLVGTQVEMVSGRLAAGAGLLVGGRENLLDKDSLEGRMPCSLRRRTQAVKFVRFLGLELAGLLEEGSLLDWLMCAPRGSQLRQQQESLDSMVS